MRPVLVLGASGFLGPRLVEAAVWAARAARVTGPAGVTKAGGKGIRKAKRREVVAVARNVSAAPGQWLEGARCEDLDLVGELEDLLDEERPAQVLLAAALSRIDACERDPAEAHLVNAEVPERAAHWCREHGTRLVHVSTDLVFSGGNDGHGPPKGGYREADTTGPLTVYGATKLVGELAVLEANPAALVVRLPLLFGDSGGRGLGASDWVRAAAAKGERLKLFTDEWRTPLDVGDAASALVELAAGDRAGLLHVAGPERLSRCELGQRVLAADGRPQAEIEARIEPSLRADAGLAAQRAEDVSLAAGPARKLLATKLRAPGAALV